MSPAINSRLVVASVLVSACAIACIASLAQAQYSSFDSDTSSELGKLMRNSGRGQLHPHSQRAFNQQAAAAAALSAAATREAQNHPLSYGPSHSNRRNYGASHSSAMNAAAGYAPIMDSLAASPREGSNLDSELNDDDEGPSYGPGYGDSSANNDEGEGSSIGEGPASSLDKAASGYTGAQHDFNGEGVGAMNFDGANFGSEFGPESSFDSETKRAKSASSPVSAKNSYESDDDAALPQYGPNSAVNSEGEEVLDGRHGAASLGPAHSDDNDNDDE